MRVKAILLYVLVPLLFSFACCRNDYIPNEKVNESESQESKIVDWKIYHDELQNRSKQFEKGLKDIIKGAVKKILPSLMSYSQSSVSMNCSRSLMKYISGLTSVQTWALKMLDSTSKPPAGILEGTISDFGAFDECLDIELPTRNGKLEFRGQYCAVEAKLKLPPIPRNFSMVKQFKTKPLDPISKYIWKMGPAFYYFKLRMGVCIPSSCSLEDVRAIIKEIGKSIKLEVKVPQCYVKEAVTFKPVHIIIICLLIFLLFLCIIGSLLDYSVSKIPKEDQKLSNYQNILVCFSLISNYQRLISSSKGSQEFKALHGMRALSMAWVMLGHNYVWINFTLLRRPTIVAENFRNLEFGIILNSWLSVESFFFLSGLLTSYTVLRLMPLVDGKINVPVYILRRYMRLTPCLLLVIGLAFFMPLVSSGPFWYEVIDRELDSCNRNWWASILYISNWSGMRNICIHPTWYLSADFQLHIVSIIVLYILYKSPRFGLALTAAVIIACNIAVGAITYIRDLPPIIQISSGNDEKIEETVDMVHMRTFTHAGPYYIGVIVGYLIIKHKNIKISKVYYVLGWSLSFILAVSSLYGAHKWNIGEPHGTLLTAIFAAVHRTTFTASVAWVAFICITGYGGIVNKLLSSTLLAPAGRLTYLVYLLHSLVFFVRNASVRERMFISHYNVLYEYCGNVAFTFALSIPVYLLLEAPLSNIERLIFSRMKPPKEAAMNRSTNGHLPQNLLVGKDLINNSKKDFVGPNSVTLTSVTNFSSA